jgi:hypothetical protein
MQSNFAKVVVVVAAIAAVVVLFVVLGGDDDPDETTTQATQTTSAAEEENGGDESQKPPDEAGGEEIPRITIVDGQPEGGVQELEFTAGEDVRFEVLSDVAEEVHVHGYDVMTDVEPGKVATIEFPADVEGVFEVELEESVVPIAELTVNPG